MTEITSYTTLIEAIMDEMDDASIEDKIPGFIQRAEAKFNRRLYSVDTEGSVPIVASTTVDLPTDYKGIISFTIDGYPPLKQLSADDFNTKWADAQPARPENFAIIGGSISLGPEPDETYLATLTYTRTLTPLSNENTSNWLLEQHPDIYLYGAMVYGAGRAWTDPRLPALKVSVEEMIIEINLYDARKRRGNSVDTVRAEYF